MDRNNTLNLVLQASEDPNNATLGAAAEDTLVYGGKQSNLDSMGVVF